MIPHARPSVEPQEQVRAALVEQAADRLRMAAAQRVPCRPVRDLIGTSDIDAAYQVQHTLADERIAAGARVVGRKIGLTAPVVQEQFGVGQPDFGVLFNDMVASEEPIARGRLLQPRVEAEIAFVLAEDLPDADATAESVCATVDHAVAAIEIVDSRIEGWDIAITDTVADNASSGMFVLGAELRTLAGFRPAEVLMSMTVDGVVRSAGTGSACLGDPLNALAWLARIAVKMGDPLRAGDVVLSGALGPVVPVHPGATVTASISGFDTVTARFGR